MALSLSCCASLQSSIQSGFSLFLAFFQVPSPRRKLNLLISLCVTLLCCAVTAQLNISSKREGLGQVKSLIARTGIPSITTSPHESLQKGNWVKLICGASFEDVADIRNLSLVYTLAGGKTERFDQHLFLLFLCRLLKRRKKPSFIVGFVLLNEVKPYV